MTNPDLKQQLAQYPSRRKRKAQAYDGPPRAVVYARFSPRPQADICDSVEKQIADCRKWCAEHSYEVDLICYDKSKKGSDPDRPGLWEAVGSLNDHTALVVRSVDRISRDRLLHETIMREIRRKGSRVVAVESGGEIGTTPGGELIANIMNDIAQYQRAMIRSRISSAYRRRVSNGEYFGGVNAPYGYQWDREHDPPRMVEHEQEQDVMELIRQMYEDGWDRASIARALNSRGYASVCRGEQWTRFSVAKIIKAEEIVLADDPVNRTED